MSSRAVQNPTNQDQPEIGRYVYHDISLGAGAQGGIGFKDQKLLMLAGLDVGYHAIVGHYPEGARRDWLCGVDATLFPTLSDRTKYPIYGRVGIDAGIIFYDDIGEGIQDYSLSLTSGMFWTEEVTSPYLGVRFMSDSYGALGLSVEAGATASGVIYGGLRANIHFTAW